MKSCSALRVDATKEPNLSGTVWCVVVSLVILFRHCARSLPLAKSWTEHSCCSGLSIASRFKIIPVTYQGYYALPRGVSFHATDKRSLRSE